MTESQTSPEAAPTSPEAAGSSNTEPPPLLVLTVLLDSSARAAAITRSHGDAIERAMTAAAGQDTAGVEFAELHVSPKAFSHLKQGLHMPPGTVALYDIFPLSSKLNSDLRIVAGQFLAAEALWALEAGGLLGGVPAAEQLSLPKGWSKDPKEIRQRLVDAGATALSEKALLTFQQVKTKWDELSKRPTS